MSLLVQASRSYIWSQFGRFSEISLLFLVSLVLARKLGPGPYGVFAFALSLIACCCLVAATGFGPEALGKFVPEAVAGYYRGGVVRLVRDLAVIRVVAIVLVAGSLFIFRHRVESLFSTTQLGNYIVFILAAFGLRSICDLFGNVFSGLLDLGVVAAGRSIAPLATLLLVGTAILSGRTITLTFAFTAWLAGQSAALAVFLLFARKRIARTGVQREAQVVSLRRVLVFGLFAWFSGFFIFVLNEGSDVILLGWLLRDARQIGWYAIGSSLAFRPSSLVLAWMSLMGMSVSAKAHLANGVEGLARATEAALKLNSLSLIPTMVVVARFAPQLVTLLYSERYEASVPVTRVLCSLLAISGFLGYGIHAGVLYVLDRERTTCAIFGGVAVVNMLLAVPLVTAFGTIGAAIATGLCSVLFASTCAIIGQPVCPVRWPWLFNIKVVLASLLGTVSTLWVNPVTPAGLVLALVLWGTVFAASLLCLKPLTSADVKPLERINPKLGYVMGRFFAGTTP
jgi:O-antigen/teichoic acid export membrane protein